MRVVTIILIVVALAVAGAMAYFVDQLLKPKEEIVFEVTETVTDLTQHEVLVSADDLAVGKIVQSEDLRWQLWPEDSVHPDYIMRIAGGDASIDQDILTDILGSAVRVEIIAGEPIISSKLFHRGDSGFLSGVLAPGMRAITVGVNLDTSGGGFVLPGDRIDLLVVFDVVYTNEVNGESTDRVVSETVLQDLRVLAVDQTVAIDSESSRGSEMLTEVAETVTLEVTPNEAQIVAVADQMGRLRLVLRSAMEGELSEPLVRFSPDYVVSQFLAQATPGAAGRVLVARHNLDKGTILTDRDWVWQAFPSDEIGSNWLREGSMDLNNLRSALTDVKFDEGEPLIVDKMILPGQDSYITSILQPGMRAFTVTVNETRGVSAFISPGDMVDIIHGYYGSLGSTVFENVRVLHVDRIFSGETGLPEMDEDRSTVTLEVTPEQAGIMSVNSWNVTLLLRGENPGNVTEYTADFGSDLTDRPYLDGIDFGDDLGNWPNDGVCDDPRFVADVLVQNFRPPKDEDRFHDASDCEELYINGEVFLLEAGRSKTGVVADTSDISNDSHTGRGEGELRVYRSTVPQDLDFSQ
jgi:pilus assembly protein CpaB